MSLQVCPLRLDLHLVSERGPEVERPGPGGIPRAVAGDRPRLGTEDMHERRECVNVD